jgi:DNA-binding SARP family transcriptional activator
VPLPMTAQRLLAFLALQERPLVRVYVAGCLWPDASEAHASANLRSTLWRLHQPGCHLVNASDQHLQLSSAVAVDAREVSELARRLLDGSINAKATDCSMLYRAGDLLKDWYDDWVLIERERIRQLRLHALELVCERMIELGDYAQAVEAGLAAVQAEPLRESAHRAVIRAHLAEGNYSEALQQYEACKKVLLQELGIGPTSRIEELLRPVRAAITRK